MPTDPAEACRNLGASMKKLIAPSQRLAEQIARAEYEARQHQPDTDSGDDHAKGNDEFADT